MARTNSTKSNRVDPTRPFYAAVGTVDIAVAAARTGLTEAQTRLSTVDLQPKALAEDLNKQYVDLAARGRTLVNRIRRQQATQDLKTEASRTTTEAKTTRTQTAKAAGTAKTAKATGTSARKTATATKKSASGAAAKTGR